MMDFHIIAFPIVTRFIYNIYFSSNEDFTILPSSLIEFFKTMQGLGHLIAELLITFG